MVSNWACATAACARAGRPSPPQNSQRSARRSATRSGGGGTKSAEQGSFYAVCERQQRPTEARAYNTLVGSWPEITFLAREDRGEERALFDGR